MTRPHWHTRPDANQQDVIDALRAGLGADAVILDCSRWASVYDLLVYAYDVRLGAYRWQPLELKTAGGELTAEQKAFQDEHPGAIPVIRDGAEGLAEFGRTQ